MTNLIDPADDREAARFADELIAVTTAERAVINAAMAWAEEWETFIRTYELTIEDCGTAGPVLAACRALRLTRKALG